MKMGVSKSLGFLVAFGAALLLVAPPVPSQPLPADVVPGPDMVWIPPGTFVMGSPTNEMLRNSTSETQHTVTLTRGFYMGKYVVTQREYLALTASNPSHFTAANGHSQDLSRPVEEVSWNDATNYCAQLTQQEQAAGRLPGAWVYRLPTEAEWEYACRAGTTTAFHYGKTLRNGMASFSAYYEYDAGTGNITTNKTGVHLHSTTRVGSYQPNAWGLHDMHGNVWEWCRDWYGAYPTGRVTDPQGPASPEWGTHHVIRGGSWSDFGQYCRSACRFFGLPDGKSDSVGFRVVLAPGKL